MLPEIPVPNSLMDIVPKRWPWLVVCVAGLICLAVTLMN